jgi:hypothetical protein
MKVPPRQPLMQIKEHAGRSRHAGDRSGDQTSEQLRPHGVAAVREGRELVVSRKRQSAAGAEPIVKAGSSRSQQ